MLPLRHSQLNDASFHSHRLGLVLLASIFATVALILLDWTSQADATGHAGRALHGVLLGLLGMASCLTLRGHPRAGPLSPWLHATRPDTTADTDRLLNCARVLDPGGVVTMLNGQRQRFYAATRDALGVDFVPIVHPDDVAGEGSFWQRAWETGEAAEHEHRYRGVDGDYRWFHTRAYPCRTTSGHIEGWHVVSWDIEDRRRAEEMLLEAQERLHHLVDHLPCMIAVADADGRLEYANQRNLRYFGKSMADVAQFAWLAGIHPQERDHAMEQWRHCSRTRCAADFYHRLLRHDGTYLWHHARIEPVFDERGALVRWYGALFDVDEQWKMAQKVRDSEAGLREMVDTIPGMISLISPEGVVEYVNRPLLEANAGSLDSARNWISRIHPADLPHTLPLFDAALLAGHPTEFEYRRLYPDGKYRWFHVRMRPSFNQDARIVRWYSLMFDVNDRREAEEALRTSVEQLRTIIDTLPAFVWQATPSGQLSYLNRRLLDYTGRSFDEHLRSGWKGIVHPADAESADAEWRHSIATGQAYRFTKRHRRADGVYRWFEERANPMLDPYERIVCWYGIDFDIDDSKQLEATLRAERARLARALKVSAVGELSASIAHEINQPLGAVVANAHACLRWLNGDPPNFERARHTAQNIVRDGRSAAEVVARIRALFRQSPPDKSQLNLNDTVREALELLADELDNNGVAVVAELQADLPVILADRVQMQQVLVNLLRNAIEAMESVDRPARRVALTSRLEPSNDVAVLISDNGTGIDDVERVFEPFFTTKSSGLGLGLSICRSIVESHGGRLRASSLHGQGTTFSFSIPLYMPDTIHTPI